ncbi:interleukin-15 receptor subunit alpha precursor isoform A [Alligator mississippiensis]|uniref:Interleukin-2 receptor subunit alpha n=1 Tax=Alligator mississippiensis TaxID=8496 RepID=A0A151NPP0_ALLMI|nr:interleukin-15 receptor subunit alpha precursor isoform A [Alligator mississippiensis]
MEHAFLLMWVIIGSIAGTGSGADKCSDPPSIEFAEFTTEKYMVSSTAQYTCKFDYRKRSGSSGVIACKNISGLVQWEYDNKFECIHISNLSSFSSLPERTRSSRPETSQAVKQLAPKGFCGLPRPVQHANIIAYLYPVGQKLQYNCLRGYDARPPTSAITTCEITTKWTTLHLRCTNDSTADPTHIIPTTHPAAGVANLSHFPPTKFPVTVTTKPFHLTCRMAVITAVTISVVLLSVFISAGWIFAKYVHRYRTRKRSFVEDANIKMANWTTSSPTAPARQEVGSEEEGLSRRP